MPAAPDPQPIVTPPAPAQPQVTFSLTELSDIQRTGPAPEVEFYVRVTQGGKYRETRWNEVETPEIKRLFDEFTKAQQELGQ